MARIRWQVVWRRIHYWVSLGVLVVAPVVIGTGILLQLKKESAWIQPPTQRGTGAVPSISFEAILEAARSVPEAGIDGWDDVDRLDVRPDKGVVKVRGVNRREVQVDAATGEVLQVAVRRSDLIESIHDGSFFHERARLWVFLPSAVGLLLLWATGAYLFVRPFLARRRRREPDAASA